MSPVLLDDGSIMSKSPSPNVFNGTLKLLRVVAPLPTVRVADVLLAL